MDLWSGEGREIEKHFIPHVLPESQCIAWKKGYESLIQHCTRLYYFVDAMTVPTLWIGTSVGSVFYVMANVPSAGETRLTQPVTLSTVGKFSNDRFYHLIFINYYKMNFRFIRIQARYPD